MQKTINVMHSREMKMRFKQIRKPLDPERSPSGFQDPEEFSEKEDNFHNMSTGLNADFEATPSQYNSENNEEIVEIQAHHTSLEAMKNELLLARLKAMAVKNQSKREDLINCDINMINKCLQNLALYFSNDEEKLEIVATIKRELTLLNSSQ